MMHNAGLRWGVAVVAMLAFGGACLAGENLLPDPSFENTKPKDQFGGVMKEWGGWIFETPAAFEIGLVARTGKTSLEMDGGRGGKIRMQSAKDIKLEPGRYRFSAFVRGLDIGEGVWGTNMDLCVAVVEKYHPIKKNGTFGWTPLTYVFDAPAGDNAKKPFHLSLGLWGDGRMWVDDVVLEKVDADTPLTPAPVWGKEEKPIAPPGKIDQAARCRTCGYRNDATWATCYACGHDMAAGARKFTTPATLVFADFEDGKPAPFEEGTAVAEHATSGKYALRVDKNWSGTGKPLDFSQHDYFKFDVFNPQDKAVELYVEIRDAQTTGYWTRVNLNTVVPPGASTVTFPTQVFVGEKSRPGRLLIRDKINRFVVSVGDQGPLFFDNFRLERLDTESVKFPELFALDFGPPGSPLMEGFDAADTATFYSAGRGYGWQNAKIWRAFDARQPEALTQDFVCPEAGAFRFDVPNGQYHVVMNIESPGNFWGEQQNYRKRSITANGKVAYQSAMDVEAFKARYFRFAATEDTPGVDPYERYLTPMDKWVSFDADVTNGKLEVGFNGQDWAICLSAMIVYPQAKAEQGRNFLFWVDQRRRVQFGNNFKQVIAAPTGAKAPAGGYVLFQRHFMAPPGAGDGPREGELLGADAKLAVTAAKGENTQLAFSLQPGGDIGKIDVQVSQLAGPNGTAMPAESVTPGWLDYRITRVTAEGSVYDVRPRYAHPSPAPALAGITRTFWLRIKPPADAAPGKYAGTVTVRPEKGEPRTLALTVTVLPFALPEIDDLPVGPWGCDLDLPWYGDDPQTQEWNWKMYEKSLRAIREAGCTSFSGRPSLVATAKDGKITLNTAQADKELAAARAAGFTRTISNYGAGSLGYSMYGTGAGPDIDAAKRGGFADMKSFLAALYGAIDAHAVEANWMPIAWNLCDEPSGDAVPPCIKNAQAHREIAQGLKRTTFMGATSMEGDDPKNPHYGLAQALPMPSLNLHDVKSIDVIHKAGGQFSFYNGSDRWTYGRYMKMLVVKQGLALRLTWHFNARAGDPYYALDCREDDYCWFNTNPAGDMIPAADFLIQIVPALNDYRYLTALQQLLAAKAADPAAAGAKKVFDDMMNLEAGKDRNMDGARRKAGKLADYEADRQKVIDAILSFGGAAAGK